MTTIHQTESTAAATQTPAGFPCFAIIADDMAAIYAVGRTEAEAIADYEAQTKSSFGEGSERVVFCSQALFDAVTADGGAPRSHRWSMERGCVQLRSESDRAECIRECEEIGRASAQARVSGQSDGVALTSAESIRTLAKALRDNPETWGAMPKGLPYGECVEHARHFEQDELRLLADGAEQDETQMADAQRE
jgi:hypothetical protein